MVIREIQLTDYRNYEKAQVAFGEGLNVLCGANAQGKTNLLEAIYLCGVGHSPRTPRDKELIRRGCDRARVEVSAMGRGGEASVQIVLDRTENKRVAIGGLPIMRLGELMGVVAAVYFSPDEMRIVKDAPGDRRKFMDVALCRIRRAYFYLLARYNKALSQRNRLLKSGKATDDVLDVWDAQLVAEGAEIAHQRRAYVERLGFYAAQSHAALSEGKELLTLSYEGIEGESKGELRQNFLRELQRTRERDRLLGFTSCGIQKDDVAVRLDGVDLRAYGSQGQQRTAALALKLAEMELHYALEEEYPVLLLDDVLSELDPVRQRNLISCGKKYQTILTCTHVPTEISAALGAYRLYSVRGGAVTPDEG